MYQPTKESITSHTVPQWFDDAKLGIFIHWGLYSIPGWAPTTGPLHQVIAEQGWGAWFGRNPYAEWYLNSLRIPGSPTAAYHREHFGETSYADLAAQFNAQIASWNPAAWAELFKQAGARYVVLTTKHHDGFLLWPSQTPNPTIPGYHAERDLVGDLTDAVRAADMRMGLYYSGGLDWTFNDKVIQDIMDLFMGVPQTPEYVAYADGHFTELIDRYQPIALWNDIAYPAAANLWQLFAHFYNSVPEGVINDRFIQGPGPQEQPTDLSDFGDGSTPLPTPQHWDYRTPEYASYPEIQPYKWETCRGLGFSFGYNRNESDAEMLSPAELVRSFVDIVSKNGNLLINVGPMGDGSIPQAQADRLLALGSWLEVNGEAIYSSRPWQRAEGTTDAGVPLRFTQREGVLYALLLDTPPDGALTLHDVVVPAGASVALLGGTALPWEQRGTDLVVTLPQLPDAPAHALRIG